LGPSGARGEGRPADLGLGPLNRERGNVGLTCSPGEPAPDWTPVSGVSPGALAVPPVSAFTARSPPELPPSPPRPPGSLPFRAPPCPCP